MGNHEKLSILTGKAPVTLNRRQFLVTTAVAGGAFMIGLTPAREAEAATADAAAWVQAEGQEFTALISILPDNTVVARSTSPDMGNGTFLGTPMLVCEELRCDWDKMKGEYLPANRDVVEGGAYSKTGGLAFFSGRTTGAAVVAEIMQLAASTRERLRTAAAAKWGVALDQVVAEMSMLTNKATNESIPFAAVAAEAAAVKLDAEPTPRPRSEWTFLGKADVKRMHLPHILDGSLQYGVDVQVPGMVYAALRQVPAQGGRLKSIANKDAVMAMPGVKAVVVVDPDQKTPGLPDGMNAPFGLFAANARQAAVAVIADHFWQAQTALDTLQIDWDLSVGAPWKDTQAVYDAVSALVKAPKEPNTIRNQGDAATVLAGGADLESDYLTPYMDHFNMEPLNGTCLVTKDRVEAWLPTQHPQQSLFVIADETGVHPKDVHVNQAWIGVGMGRRVFGDDTRMVAAVAAQYPDVPVKVIWTREESMRQGRYRNLVAANMKAKMGADGMPEAVYICAGGTGLGLEGAMFADSPYQSGVKNWKVDASNFFTNIQLGPWRGPVFNSNSFMIETFINEMAEKSGIDAIEFRQKLLSNYEDKSWSKLLDVVKEKSGWGGQLDKGQAQGVAIANWGMAANPQGGPTPYSGTTVACVVTAEVGRRGDIFIPRVDMAIDTGSAINLKLLRQACESGCITSIGSAMFEELNIADGKIVDGNLDSYKVIRQTDGVLPLEINVWFEGMSGHERMSEIGEPPVGAPAPALAHAVYRATGTWMRSMPFSKIQL